MPAGTGNQRTINRKVLNLIVPDCVPEYTNVALNKLVTMSSMYDATVPGSKAVDGQKIGDWNIDGCACTLPEKHPWLLLDLGAKYTICSIFILNRLGSTCKCVYHARAILSYSYNK